MTRKGQWSEFIWKKVKFLCFWHRLSSLKPLITNVFRFFDLKEKKIHQVTIKAQDLPSGELEIYFGSNCFS
jgi:hypothetical protein